MWEPKIREHSGYDLNERSCDYWGYSFGLRFVEFSSRQARVVESFFSLTGWKSAGTGEVLWPIGYWHLIGISRRLEKRKEKPTNFWPYSRQFPPCPSPTILFQLSVQCELPGQIRGIVLNTYGMLAWRCSQLPNAGKRAGCKYSPLQRHEICEGGRMKIPCEEKSSMRSLYKPSSISCIWFHFFLQQFTFAAYRSTSDCSLPWQSTLAWGQRLICSLINNWYEYHHFSDLCCRPCWPLRCGRAEFSSRRYCGETSYERVSNRTSPCS